MNLYLAGVTLGNGATSVAWWSGALVIAGIPLALLATVFAVRQHRSIGRVASNLGCIAPYVVFFGALFWPRG